LTIVDELIQARHTLHGGFPGAPNVVAGYRVGTSINRSAVVMISALLQVHVEEVFLDCSKITLPGLADDRSVALYRGTFRRWGNPSVKNVRDLFRRIGVQDVFDGLSWQRCLSAAVREKLEKLNQLRNQVAHGADHLILNRERYSLSLAEVYSLRNFAEAFGNRFPEHAASFLS
jgi:hypothetical protein